MFLILRSESYIVWLKWTKIENLTLHGGQKKNNRNYEHTHLIAQAAVIGSFGLKAEFSPNIKHATQMTYLTQRTYATQLPLSDTTAATTNEASDRHVDTRSFLTNMKLLDVCFLKYMYSVNNGDLFLFIYFIRSCVVRHLIVKTDDRVTEGVRDNYSDSCCVNFYILVRVHHHHHQFIWIKPNTNAKAM